MDADRRANEPLWHDPLGRYRRWRSAKASPMLRSAGVSAVAKRGGKGNRGECPGGDGARVARLMDQPCRDLDLAQCVLG